MPDWAGIRVQGWLASADPAIDLEQRLGLESISAGQRYRFRLRANPCVSRNGNRQGLLRTDEQETWLRRKGERCGFSLPRLAGFDLGGSVEDRVDVRISQEQMLRGNHRAGHGIRVFSVLYDGLLTVEQPEAFNDAVVRGIGHGKVMGLGLLSVVPAQ